MVHAVFRSDGKWFIARWLDVPVSTQGRTLAAAKRNLREAVELYLETWGEPKGAEQPQEVYLTSMEVGA
jgi:predicted RNase H-like HicB family nuclease